MDPSVQLAVLQPDEVEVVDYTLLLKWGYVLHVRSLHSN
jgi:hypothetical protein